ncbi:MAG: hypothetical protein M3Y54_14435 [Bacteroidota bacterium]|nr:hypothetical protein [Bacteroidota bacterium]
MKTSLLSLIAALGIFATTTASAAPARPPFRNHEEISRVERERAAEMARREAFERSRREAVERARREAADRARLEAQRRAEQQRAAERDRWEREQQHVHFHR